RALTLPGDEGTGTFVDGLEQRRPGARPGRDALDRGAQCREGRREIDECRRPVAERDEADGRGRFEGRHELGETLQGVTDVAERRSDGLAVVDEQHELGGRRRRLDPHDLARQAVLAPDDVVWLQLGDGAAVFVEHRDRDRTLPGLLGTGGQRGGRSSGGGDGGDSEKRAPGTRKAHWDTPSGEYSVLRLGYDRYEDLRGSIAKSARGRCTTE